MLLEKPMQNKKAMNTPNQKLQAIYDARQRVRLRI
jgi:hypothetical protein